MSNFLFFLFILYLSKLLLAEQSPERIIQQGKLKGKFEESKSGRKFSAFTGIPYAKPPVKELRFKAPVPAEPWKDVLDATHPHSVCPQIDIYINDFVPKGIEDCLYLNIYTPQLSESNKEVYPVLFYIHGGGFMTGSGNADLYGPHLLLNKNVVLVTANYRLGALGFLSTGDSVVPGNNGLKDQALAIKWVKNNIQHFGGNPDKITIFGQSAGAASAHYHILSPLTRDLVSGVIIQSGSALASWALSSKKHAVEATHKLANLLNCTTSSSSELVNCLSTIDPMTFLQQDFKYMEWHYDPIIPFKPVVEDESAESFLTDLPVNIIKSGKSAKVPMVIGFTEEEAAFKTALIFNDTKLVQSLDKDFDKIIPLILLLHKTEFNNPKFTKQMAEFYLDKKHIDEKSINQLTKLITDGWFTKTADTTVQLHTKYTKQSVYYYLFGYRGSMSFVDLFGNTEYDYGVSHCDDLLYLFSNKIFPNSKPTDSDKRMIDIMTTLWTNFAASGTLTPKTNNLIKNLWKPIESKALEYYFIKDDEHMTMERDMYPKRIDFWRKSTEKHLIN